MALGTERAGFRHVALLELDRHAVATLHANSESGVGVTPEMPLEVTDVTQFDFGTLGGEIDLLAAGAPCQPFSLAGKHAGQRDQRNLFPEVFRAQRALKPKAVILENVRGLGRPGFRPYLEYILLQLALPGIVATENEGWREHKRRLQEALARNERGEAPAYHVTAGFRECADFGLPQRRARVFMVAVDASTGGPVPVPEGSLTQERLEFDKRVTGEYWARHALTPPKGKVNGGRIPKVRPASEPWRTVRDALGGLPLPLMGRANGHHPNHIGIPGARAYPGHTGSLWDEPAKTLKAGVHGVPGGENMLRDDAGAVRYFTVHEAAILQGFPEAYVFRGSRSEAMRQIGNAAPPKVCETIAAAVGQHLGARHGRAKSIDGTVHVDLMVDQQLALL